MADHNRLRCELDIALTDPISDELLEKLTQVLGWGVAEWLLAIGADPRHVSVTWKPEDTPPSYAKPELN